MVIKASRKLSSRLTRWRHWIQAAFLFVWLDPFMLRLHGVCSPVFHCYSCPLATFACPIGVVANFSALHVFPFLAFGTLLLFAGLLAALVCGWLCPFGFVQDMAAKIPTRKFNLPGWAGYTRYVVLVVAVLAVPWFLGKDHALFICTNCPVGALEGAGPLLVKNAIQGEPIIWPNAIKLSIVGALVVAVFFVRRPWCRLLCPLGAIYGLFNRSSAFKLRASRHLCTSCGACKKMCPYGLNPEHDVDSSRCVRCLECAQCGAISMKPFYRRHKAPEPDTARNDTAQ